MAVSRQTLGSLCCGIVFAALAGMGQAQSEEPGCLDCHEPAKDPAMHVIANTVHGGLAGGGAAACTACHGPSEAHDRRPKKNPPDVSFGPQWPSDAETRSASCQTCHDSGDQLLWTGSGHQQENLSCDSCHTAHEQQILAGKEQAADKVCLECHARVRSEMHLPSRHPIAEGKTSCTDCHNPHGGTGHADLREVSVNENCFTCHQEKRGPFLWEHQPVAEDCGLCHKPHGSVNEPLLTTRGPALCQQCHAAAFHPSQPYGSQGLPGGTANQNMLGKNCLNCHSQVHGSNHPSGARLTR